MNMNVVDMRRSVVRGSGVKTGRTALLTAISAPVLGFSSVLIGGVANYLVPLCALVVGLYLVVRNRPAAYITFLLGVWIFAPFVRRVVDYQVGFSDQSLILLSAPLASVPAILGWSRRGTQGNTFDILFIASTTIGVLFATAIGIRLNGVEPAVVGMTTLVCPLLCVPYLLSLERPSRSEVFEMLPSGGLVYLGAVSLYGIGQWYLAPAWDTEWIKNVADVAMTFGKPEPQGIRVFSTLNSPFPLGIVLVFLILLQVGRPATSLRVLVVGAAMVCLGLSAVRAAWVMLALTIVLLIVTGSVRRSWVAALILLGIVGTLLVPPAVSAAISDRADSIGAGSSDISLAARLELYSNVVPPLLSNPVGSGLGFVGAGVRSTGESGAAGFADTDSTYISALRLFGPVFALAILLGLIAISLRALAAPGRLNRPSGLAAFAASLVAVFLLGDMLSGVTAFVVWLVLASELKCDPKVVGDSQSEVGRLHD